jgi:hypothetical protein
MIDINIGTLALLALIIRLIGALIFIFVLIHQLKLRLKNGNDDLNGFRDLLIILTAMPLLFNFIAIYNNFLIFNSGEQNELINSISFVFGAVASTATAIVLLLIYRKK